MAYEQPVKPTDELKVTIDSIGEKGDGIARYNNFVIIVPETKVDSTYFIRIKKVFPKFAMGEVIENV